MVTRKESNLVTNNSQFYFLIPRKLLERCRREASRKSISTAAFLRMALVAYINQQDMKDATASPEPSMPICEHTKLASVE
jgi:hypothetical protein